MLLYLEKHFLWNKILLLQCKIYNNETKTRLPNCLFDFNN